MGASSDAILCAHRARAVRVSHMHYFDGSRCEARTGPIRPLSGSASGQTGANLSETGRAAPSPAETVAMARGMEGGLKLLEPQF